MSKLNLSLAILAMFVCGCNRQSIQPKSAICAKCSQENTGLALTGIIHIYNKGNVYISNHTHYICLCDNSIVIKSIEPNGIFEAVLNSHNSFSVIQAIDNVEIPKFYEKYSSIINSAVRANFSTSKRVVGEPCNLYGQWYNRIDNTDNHDFELYSAENRIVLVHNNDTVVRLFNFVNPAKVDILIPSTIEIYEKGSRNVLGEKKMNINYFAIEKQ